MKRTLPWVLGVAWFLGCQTGSELPDVRKGVIDVQKMRDNEPWPVRIDGDTASVKVPFVKPVPEAADDIDDAEAEIANAVMLVVKSGAGATANLSTGKLVSSAPNEPGEFIWELNEARDEATLTFFNESLDGRTLKTDRMYTVEVSVTKNAYIGEVEATTFQVQPR